VPIEDVAGIVGELVQAGKPPTSLGHWMPTHPAW
jgi:hypothetical protein